MSLLWTEIYCWARQRSDFKPKNSISPGRLLVCYRTLGGFLASAPQRRRADASYAVEPMITTLDPIPLPQFPR